MIWSIWNISPSAWIVMSYAALLASLSVILLGAYILWRAHKSKGPQHSPVILYVALSLATAGSLAPFALTAATRFSLALTALTRSAPPPDGPYAVRHLALNLPSGERNAASIAAQLWFPAQSNTSSSTAITPCTAALAENLPPQVNAAPLSLILYAPSWDGTYRNNALQLADIASHGYAALAIDDIVHDEKRRDASPLGEQARFAEFDDSSAKASARTTRLGAVRVRLEAQKLIDALDRLQHCVAHNPHWRNSIIFTRVGAFGFSFGGAVSAEAAIMDPRIAAAVNLDGTLFGQAASGALSKPYLFFSSDIRLPTATELRSPRRYEYMRLLRDVEDSGRQSERRDNFVYSLLGAHHLAFADDYFDMNSWWPRWFLLDPFTERSVTSAYILDFFGVYVRGRPSALLFQHRSLGPYLRSWKVSPPPSHTQTTGAP